MYMEPMQPMQPMMAQPMMAQPMMVPTYAPPPPPPAYYPPPPPPQQQGPMIINLQGNQHSDGSPCPTCGKDTGNVARKTVGCVTIVWCIVLLIISGGVACCYPFCTDSCKDTELVCVRCQTVKSKVPANCC